MNKAQRLIAPLVLGLSALAPVGAQAQGNTPSAPELPPDLPPAVRAYLEALQKRVQELENKVGGQTTGGKVPGAAGAVHTQRGSRLEIGGFVESRITNVGSSGGTRTPDTDLDFQINKFRPRFMYHLDNHWQADLQLNASTRSNGTTSVNARDAFVQYDNAGYRLRFGQQKEPFGYQVYVEGDEDRAALERARIFAVLLPDERDVGFVASTNSKNTRSVRAAVGVINGNGINQSDNNSDKDFVGTVKIPLGAHHTIGFSGYTGNTTTVPHPDPSISFKKQLAGFDYQGNIGKLNLQAELAMGRALGVEVNGGYGQLDYLLGKIGHGFVRHDWFDPNASGPGRDYWSRTSAGWYKDFTRNLRITAEYDWVDNLLTHTDNDDTYGVEFQARF